MLWKPPSASWGGEGGSYECEVRPGGQLGELSKIHKSSLAAPKWITDFGLDCYEYQCGKGVHVGEETCRKLGENARAAGISLSLHAPYFINLANPDPEAVQKTIGYVTAACQAASWMGAERVVIHSGGPDEALPAGGPGDRPQNPAPGDPGL